MQGEDNCDKGISQLVLRTWTNVHSHTLEEELDE